MLAVTTAQRPPTAGETRQVRGEVPVGAGRPQDAEHDEHDPRDVNDWLPAPVGAGLASERHALKRLVPTSAPDSQMS
jgi:hypothetical protein